MSGILATGLKVQKSYSQYDVILPGLPLLPLRGKILLHHLYDFRCLLSQSLHALSSLLLGGRGNESPIDTLEI